MTRVWFLVGSWWCLVVGWFSIHFVFLRFTLKGKILELTWLVVGFWFLVVGFWLGFREVLDTFCLSSFHFERQNT
jgi:hypothetical protein